MEMEDEECEIQKPQMRCNEDEEEIKDHVVNTILILELQMINKLSVITTEVNNLGCKNLKMIFQGFWLTQQKYSTHHQGYLHNHQNLLAQSTKVLI
jgi:hypothetical protein